MFEKASVKFTDILADKGVIQSSAKEVCAYGLRQIFSSMINAFTTLLIGIVMGMIIEAVIFTIAYITIRIYAGGYHAKTPFRCYLLSIAILAAVMICMKHLTLNNIVYYLLMIMSSATILYLSPVEDKNKPLDEKEIRVYKKRAACILIFEFILFIVMNILDLQMFSAAICYAMVMLGILLIAGKEKNRRIP